MIVEVVHVSRYEVDVAGLKRHFAKELQATLDRGETEKDFIEESFGELVLPDRDEDHTGYGVIRRVSDTLEVDWEPL